MDASTFNLAAWAARILQNILYAAWTAIVWLVNRLTDFLPWECPIESGVSKVGTMPDIVLAWADWAVDFGFVMVLWQAYIGFYAASVIFRAVDNHFTRINNK